MIDQEQFNFYETLIENAGGVCFVSTPNWSDENKNKKTSEQMLLKFLHELKLESTQFLDNSFEDLLKLNYLDFKIYVTDQTHDNMVSIYVTPKLCYKEQYLKMKSENDNKILSKQVVKANIEMVEANKLLVKANTDMLEVNTKILKTNNWIKIGTITAACIALLSFIAYVIFEIISLST